MLHCGKTSAFRSHRTQHIPPNGRFAGGKRLAPQRNLGFNLNKVG
jgi:hypothetical protein